MKIHPTKVQPPAAPQATTPAWMFKPVERPSYTDSLKFPDDITKLTLANVSMLHGQYTGLYGYAVSELSKASIHVLRIRSEIFVRRNNISRTGLTNGRKKHAIDIDVRIDKALENLTLKETEAETKVKELEAYVIIFDKYMGALSREMTRRTSELQRT